MCGLVEVGRGIPKLFLFIYSFGGMGKWQTEN